MKKYKGFAVERAHIVRMFFKLQVAPEVKHVAVALWDYFVPRRRAASSYRDRSTLAYACALLADKLVRSDAEPHSPLATSHMPQVLEVEAQLVCDIDLRILDTPYTLLHPHETEARRVCHTLCFAPSLGRRWSTEMRAQLCRDVAARAVLVDPFARCELRRALKLASLPDEPLGA